MKRHNKEIPYLFYSSVEFRRSSYYSRYYPMKDVTKYRPFIFQIDVYVTAPSHTSRFLTPYNACSGPGLHANVIHGVTKVRLLVVVKYDMQINLVILKYV